MAEIGEILNRLDKVKKTGGGRWLARCPAHEDRSPSLAIRALDDGRVLLHCFAGCSVDDVLAAIGLDMADLFPSRPNQEPGKKREVSPFYALDILRALSYEVLIVQIAAASLAEGRPLADQDQNRLMLAKQRIDAGLEMAEGRHYGKR